LEKISQKFGENVLDATKKFEKLIIDKKEIEGLPATALGLAAQTAVSKVFLAEIHLFWLFNICFVPQVCRDWFLSYLVDL
jgi:Zn-dependent oligopeptidase